MDKTFLKLGRGVKGGLTLKPVVFFVMGGLCGLTFMVYSRSSVASSRPSEPSIVASPPATASSHASKISWHKTQDPSKSQKHSLASLQFLQVLASAYSNSPDLRQKFFQSQGINEGVAKAKSGWRPTLNLESLAQRTRLEKEISSPASAGYTTTQGNVSVRQNVFNGGGTLSAVSAAQNQARAGLADFSNTEQSALLGAAIAYFDLFAAIKVYNLNVKNVDTYEKLLESVKTRAKLGELTGTDVANGESQLADAVTQRISALADLESKRANYVRAVGELPPEVLDLPPLPLVFIPKNLNLLLEGALRANPAVINADYAVRSSRDGIGVSRASVLPTVNLAGSAQRSVVGNTGGRVQNDRGNTYQATATLTVPLYQGGGEWSDLRKAYASATQSKVALEGVRLDVRKNSAIQWQSWISAQQRIDQIKTKIKSAKVTLEGVRSEFKEGERIFLEVLQAENTLFQTEVSLEQATRDLYVAAYNIISLLGKLNAQEFNLPVVKYDLERHYRVVSHKLFGTLETQG